MDDFHAKMKRLFWAPGLITILTKAILLLLLLCLSSCSKKEPIKVGLSATLSGTDSSFGQHVARGIILAVEEVNKEGGINGRKVELIIKDDRADPEEALKVDNELIEEGVVAIMGHYMSSLAVKTVPLMNERNILMIGATVSTPQLNGLDDNFIRVALPSNRLVPTLSTYSYKRLNLKRMAFIYDTSNLQYVEPIYRQFKEEFEKLGGEVKKPLTFNGQAEFSVPDLVEELIASDPDGLYIIANALHSALICQHLRKRGATFKIVTSPWAFTDPDFIINGGQAVEGVVTATSFNKNSKSEPFLTYKMRYEERFNEEISLGNALGYEAALLLLAALKKTDDPAKLKDVILNQRIYPGLDGKIILDRYGDPIRTTYIEEIREGKIEIIERFEAPEESGE